MSGVAEYWYLSSFKLQFYKMNS